MKKSIYLLVIILILIVILAACGGEDPDRPIGTYDFDTVCKGEGLPKGMAYDSAQTGIQRITVMSDSTIGAQYDDYSPHYMSNAPEEWFPQVVDGTYSYADVPLTGCIHRTSTTQVDACEFEDDYTLIVYEATYEVSVRATQTGEVIAQETMTAPAECPTMHMFTDGEYEEDYFAVIDDQTIQNFIEPYVTP